MARPMKKRDLVRRAHREIKAAFKLSPVILIAVLLIVAFGGTDLAATSGLFQSPPTETPTQPASPTPAETPTLPPTEAPTLEPTLVPAPTLPLTATVAATATLPPTATTPPLPSATGLAPAETPSPVPTAATAEEGTEGPSRYVEGESSLKFDWSMLMDAVALALSYLWLCCGVLVLVGIPLIFLILWLLARRHKTPQ